ncbi:hypothetical protein B0H13DRAFT_2134017 [Mycena leptocephala]|nr:hypothetical protein B0H13DRAFT_2134017 [Mycena leptocephala]
MASRFTPCHLTPMDSSTTYGRSSTLFACDVILYPSDGGESHIVSKLLTEMKVVEPSPGLDMYTMIIFDPLNLGVEDMAARRSKVWGVESLDPDEQYVLYHNISPDLPVNQTMARLVGADPEQRSRRMLWRGDVFVVKRRKWPTRMRLGHPVSHHSARGHMEYVDMPPHTLELFNSRLIPQWYNSDEWLHFLQNEVNMHESCWPLRNSFSFWACLCRRKTKHQTMYDKKARMIEKLIMANRLRDPRETIIRNVILYPAAGGRPRITPMPFSEDGTKALPYGGDLYTSHVDLRSLYGAANMFATRHTQWNVDDPADDMEERYIAYHNLSPQLPVNATMARLVGANPSRPGRHHMWRGDVVVVKQRDWPGPFTRGGGLHIDYVNMPPHAMDLLNTHLIPKWYNSQSWLDFLQSEEQWNEQLRNDPIYVKTAKLIAQLKAMEPGPDGY